VSDSKYYVTNPDDPDAPIVLTEYDGIRPGDVVRYVGPVPLMAAPLIVSELIRWPQDDLCCAILNDGEFEVNADNLSLLAWSEHL